MIPLLATLLLFPFNLHPPIGLVVAKLIEGRRGRGFFIAVASGFFYDLSINHLPFGLYTLFYLVGAALVETFRSLLFLGRTQELFFLPLLFALVVQGGEALFLQSETASFWTLFAADGRYLIPLKEAIIALSLFEGLVQLQKRWKFYRLRQA